MYGGWEAITKETNQKSHIIANSSPTNMLLFRSLLPLLIALAPSAIEAFISLPPNHSKPHSTELHVTRQQVASALLGATLAFGSFFPPPAMADSSRLIGNIAGSGLVFKDTLEVEAFPDPKVKGVNLFISNFQIPMTERISKAKLFSDPAYASVACSRGKNVQVADNIGRGPAGEEVFEESKSLLFKTLRVQRIYDEETNTLVYVSFNTRLDKDSDSNKSRFKSSICAINLD